MKYHRTEDPMKTNRPTEKRTERPKKTPKEPMESHWNWTHKPKQHKHSETKLEWMKYKEIPIKQHKMHEERRLRIPPHPHCTQYPQENQH